MRAESPDRNATQQKSRPDERADGRPVRTAKGLPDPAKLDELLDEELDETFPASDPLPWSHRVD